MRSILAIILFCCLMFSCKKERVVNYDALRTDDKINSMNCDIISMNQKNIFLYDGMKIAFYDFNGNKLNYISAPFDSYNSMAVCDSILVLSRHLQFYRIQDNSTVLPIKVNRQNFHNYRPINEVVIADTTIIVLNGRLSTLKDDGINKKNGSSTYSLPRSLSLFRFISNNNVISELNLANMTASSFTVMQDSVVFFMNNNISRFNINDVQFNVEVAWFGQNPGNEITTTISKANQLFTSNSKSIFFFDYINDNLNLRGEIR